MLLHFGVAVTALQEAIADTVGDDVAMQCAGLEQLRRQPIHLGVALIAYDQPCIAVDHAQSLRHVLDGGGKTHVLFRQIPLADQFGFGERADLVGFDDFRMSGVEALLLPP